MAQAEHEAQRGGSLCPAGLDRGFGASSPFTEGALFALTCTAVSYAAMCSGERCCSYKDMLTISGVCSLVIYFGQSVLTGIGGRLGTSAAISVLLCLLVRNVLNLDKAQKAAKS